MPRKKLIKDEVSPNEHLKKSVQKEEIFEKKERKSLQPEVNIGLVGHY